MKLGDHWRNSEDGKKQAAPKQVSGQRKNE